jgi:hypothetical protein
MTGDQVDTSELIRVFGKISEQAETPVQTDQLAHRVTSSEQALLQDKIGLLESQIKDLKDDRDQWRIKTSEMADLLKSEQSNIKLLSHQAPQKAGDNMVLAVIAVVAAFALFAALFMVWQLT